MKLKDIEVGGRYEAKVSGKRTVVRVVEIRQVPGRFNSGRSTTDIYAINERTGKRLTIRLLRRALRALGDEPQGRFAVLVRTEGDGSRTLVIIESY